MRTRSTRGRKIFVLRSCEIWEWSMTVDEEKIFYNEPYLGQPLDSFLSSQEAENVAHFFFYAGMPHLLVNHHDYSEAETVREKLEERHLRADAMIPAGYGYSIFADPQTELYRASKAYYENCIRAAKIIGSKRLFICPCNGILSKRRDENLKNAARMVQELLPAAGEQKVQLALGTNTRGNSAAINTLNELYYVYKIINDESLGIFYDVLALEEAGETPEMWKDAWGEKEIYIYPRQRGRQE